MNVETRTLLDMAKENIKVSEGIRIAYPSDDGFTNYEGYHYQQAVELSLKHLLETHGIEYPKTHAIEDLIKLLPQKYKNITKDISENSRMISHLEADTRYKKSYKASRDLINKASELADNLIKDIEKIEEQEKGKIEKQIIENQKEFHEQYAGQEENR